MLAPLGGSLRFQRPPLALSSSGAVAQVLDVIMMEHPQDEEPGWTGEDPLSGTDGVEQDVNGLNEQVEELRKDLDSHAVVGEALVWSGIWVE